jgi:gliding motility-associated-like protein
MKIPSLSALRLFFWVCGLFSVTELLAQKEANNWYFGNNAGISFSSGSPVANSNGALVTMEGVSSISDAAGNLLLYTNGMTIYDKTHNAMPNGSGLLGGTSSSQSAVIIRRPGSSAQYFVFTAAQDENPDGICYSLVNMTLNGGKGDVTATKNIKLMGPATEKLTAINHCNRRDVWVIAHEFGTNRFFAWLVTSAGVSSSPVISSAGSVHNAGPIGCMKVSPDGKHLALGHYISGGNNFIELFDFDNTTGTVSNPIRFDYGSNCYGVEFSPNSRFLYFTASPGATSISISIYQADLCAGSSAQIKSSAQVIGNSSNGFIRTLQLGADGKIYFSRFAMTWVGVIPSPNTAGPGCGFNVDAVPLVSGTLCRAGLPNFNQSFFQQEIDYTYTLNCYTANFSSQQVFINQSCTDPVTQIRWNFGDPASGAANTSTLQNPSHTYSAPGNYQVSMIVSYNCGADTLIKTLNVNCGPQVSVNSSTICAGTCVNLQATTTGGQPPYTYSWAPALGNGAGPHNVCPGSSTNYTVTVTDAGGKTHSAVAAITVSGVPVPSLNATNPSCNGGNNGSIAASVTGPGGPFTYSWSTNPAQTSATLSGVPAGSYTLTVKNANNCSLTASNILVDPPALNLSLLNKTDVSCKGGNNATASISASGGLAPYTLSWSGGQSGTSVNNLTAGSHTATVTDANGCSASIQVNISEPAAISISNAPTAASCGQPNGSIQANVTGGTAPYSYSWNSSPVQTTALASGLNAANYTLTVTDAKGCVQTKSETLTGTTLPGLTINTLQVSCNAGSDGSAAAVGSAGTAPYSIQWSSGTSGTSVGRTGIAGSYSATLTDAAGCTATKNFTINQPTALSLNTSSTAATCGASNGAASVSISGGTAPYSTVWSSGASGNNASSLAAGSYTVTVTDAKGCSATQSVGVSNSSGPSLSLLSSTDVSCKGGNNASASISASGGLAPYTFSWSGGQSGTSVNNLTAGSHTATVTDANGCSASIQVNISEPAAISISNAPTAASCGQPNGSIQATVSGGTAPYTFSWNSTPVQTGTQATGLAAGNYTLTVTDAKGCVQTKTETLSGTTLPALSISTQAVSCNGGNNGAATAAGSAGTAPYSIQWSSGTSGTSVAGLAAGSYSATLTDAAGCTATQNFAISQPTALSLNTSSTAATCGASNGAASVSISGGTAPYSTVWSSGASGNNASSLAAGSYTVTVTDAKGCSATQSVGVSNSSGPSLSLLSSTYVSCKGGNNASASISASGGLAPYTFSWSGGQSGTSVNNLTAGSHTATVTDANGCSASIQVNISEPAAISISNAPTAASCGQPNGSIQANVTGGTAPYSYSWNSSPVQTTALASGLNAANYTLTVTDAKGCVQTKSETLTGTTLPALTINTLQVSCNAGSDGSAAAVGSAGTAPYSIQWSSGTSGTSVAGLAAGSYSATLTDAAGCTATKNFTINQPTALSLNTSSTAATCGASNGAASVSISGGTAPYSTVWSSGTSGNNASSLAAGSYTVTVTDAKGCSATQSVGVSNSSGPSLSLLSSTYVSCKGGNNASASISASGGLSPYTFSWSGGQSGTSVNNLTAGSHTATVTDANGCSASIQVNISEPAAISISNAPTAASCGQPNGSIQANVTGGTAPYSYSWNSSPVQTTELASGLNAANYTLTVTDAKGCVQTKSETLTGTTLPALTINTLQVSCNAGSDGSAAAVGSAGTAPYSIQWSSGTSGTSVAGLAAGSYSATLTDAAGCTATQNFTINQPTALSLNTSSTAATCGASNGAASVSISGGTAPYSTVWSSGASGNNASSLAAGSYTVTVTDAKGCSATQSVGVSNSSGPAISVTMHTDVKCYGGNEGKITVQVSGGVPPLQINWSNGNTGLQAVSLTAGLYIIAVTDASGCSASISQEILQPPAMLVAVSASNANCGQANGSAEAMVTGGTAPYQYNWQGTISTNAKRDQLLPGDYSLQVTDAAGCLVNEIFQVGNHEGPLANIEVLNAITCPGGSDGALQVRDMNGSNIIQVSWNDGSNGLQLQNLAAGSYSVTITDTNGCSSNSQMNLQAPSNWQIFLNLQPSTCGQPNGSASLLLSGANPPYQITWANGQSGLTATGLLAGVTTAQITDSKGCKTATNAVINDEGGLSLQVSELNAVSCYGATDGSVKVHAAGGTAPYQYTWIGGGNGNIRTGMAAGLYVAEVTDANGCKAQAQAELISPAALSANLDITGTSCGLDNGQAIAQVSGGTSPYFYQWSNGSQNSQTGSLPAGQISVLVTDANGCQVSAGEQITPGAGLRIQLNILNKISCSGRQDGSIEIHSGGTILSGIVWSNGANGMINQNLGAGRYEVIATDNGGCKDTAAIDLSEPDPLGAAIQVSAATCSDADGGAIVSASGGRFPYTYAWSNGMNTAQVNQLIAGTYEIQISDASGCTFTKQVAIPSKNSLVITDVQVSDVKCNGLSDGKATILFNGANGLVEYNWSNGSRASLAENLAAGSYTIRIRDQSGCEADKAFQVSQPNQIEVLVSTEDANCQGGDDGKAQAFVSGGNLPYQYTWNGISGTEQKSGMTAGNYSLEVKDASGCVMNKNFIIEEPQSLKIETRVFQPRCGQENGSVETEVHGGTAPYSYSWSHGATNADISALPSGQYQLKVLDAHGCTLQSAYRLYDPGAPVATVLQQKDISCFGLSNGAIQLNGSGGTGNLQLSWDDVSGGAYERYTLGKGLYRAFLTDSLGCSDTLTIEIREPELLQLNLETRDVRCAGGSDGWISSIVSGGIAPYRYEWSDGRTGLSELSQIGSGSWGLHVIDANGCGISRQVQIKQPDPLVLDIETKAANCFNSPDGNALARVNGGVPPYQFRWSNGIVSALADSLRSGIYQVYVSDSNACGISGKAMISQPSKLSGQISSKTAICRGDSLVLYASGSGGVAPYSFSWMDGTKGEQNIQQPDSNETFEAYVTDAQGCVESMTRMVKVMDLPLLEIVSGNQAVCSGECVTLEALSINNQTYQWKDQNGTLRNGASVSYCYEKEGGFDITLTVSNEHQCTSSIFVNDMIVVNPLPVVEFEADKNNVPLLDALIRFENHTQGTNTYRWDFDSRNEGSDSDLRDPVYRYNQPGQYPVVLTAINEFGCSSTSTRFIEILEDFAVYIPNTFTPNRDGTNEVFKPEGIGISENNYQFVIFNKWGERVFESQLKAIGWDGSSQGNYGKNDAAEGVYVWKLYLQDFLGEMHKYSGTVTLVR